MVDGVEKIWMNGKLVNWDDAQVHVLTHTLHYGMGVYEGIRCYEQPDGSAGIFRLKEHIDRLYESTHMFGLEIPYSKEEVLASSKEILKVNGLKTGYLRPLVYIGAGSMGVNFVGNPICLALIPWGWKDYLGQVALDNGIRGKISSYTRIKQSATLPKAKACGNYINSILAKKEAIDAGYDEALLLDSEGYLVEASVESIFMVKDGIVRTPSMDSVALKGITRASVIQMCQDEGIEVREEKFAREDAYVADEFFITGTAAEICGMSNIDGRKIGTGKPGPVTQKIQKLFFDTVRGKNDKYKEWVTVVE